MVARRGAVALAAVIGVSLQGCSETINKHITSLIESSCAAATGGQVNEAKKKLMVELRHRCSQASENGTLTELYQQCLDEGATALEADVDAAGEKATADCVEKLQAAADGRDINNVVQKAHDLIHSSLFNLTETVHKHINETAQHIHDQAKDALDTVKGGANDAIDGAKDKLDEVKDGVNGHIDGAHGHNDDALDAVQAHIEGQRLFSMVRLPGTKAGSSTVACLSGAALLAVAGLVVVVRRASRQAVAEQSTPILACDEELQE